MFNEVRRVRINTNGLGGERFHGNRREREVTRLDDHSIARRVNGEEAKKGKKRHANWDGKSKQSYKGNSTRAASRSESSSGAFQGTKSGESLNAQDRAKESLGERGHLTCAETS